MSGDASWAAPRDEDGSGLPVVPGGADAVAAAGMERPGTAPSADGSRPGSATSRPSTAGDGERPAFDPAPPAPRPGDAKMRSPAAKQVKHCSLVETR